MIDIEPYNNQKSSIVMIKEYLSIIKTDGRFLRYENYLDSNAAFYRLMEFCQTTGNTFEWFKGKKTLDIAGGNLGTADGAHYRDPVFYPWFSVATDMLGASAVSIDKDELPPDTSNFPVEEQELLHGITSCYQHIASDLKQDLFHPEQLLERLNNTGNLPTESYDLVNCSMLVSLDSRVKNAPSFLSTLGIDMDRHERPIKSPENDRKLIGAADGVFTLALSVLKNQGYLLFNDQVYRKFGDTFIWIQNNKYTEAKRATDHALSRRTIDSRTGEIEKDGMILYSRGMAFRSKAGSWVVDHTKTHDLEPIP